MSGVFAQALGRASLSGGVMILAVLVLRQCFQNRVSRRVFCLLWDLSLVRLLILGEIPSPLSIRAWLPALFHRADAAVGKKASIMTAAIPAQEIYPGNWAGSTAVSSTLPAPESDTVLTLIWLIVALVLAAVFLRSHLRSRLVYASSLPCDDAFVLSWLEDRPLRRMVQIRTSDRVAAPLTYGIFCPVILLPAEMNWAELTCVLEHEYARIRRFDTLRKALLVAVLCLHWFNPMTWAFYVLANRDMELCCDEMVIHVGGDREKYALALLGMEEQRGKWRLSGSHFSQNALEERVKAIMKQKHYSIAALVTVLAVMSCTVTVFASAAPEDRQSAPKSSYVYNHYQAVENDVMILSDGETGNRQYSVDGGQTWMEEEQYQTRYGSGWGDDWQVEWWTAEDYALWLDEEKQTLQSIIGEKGYNSTDGWFIWDQERVDAAIALYEGILEDIQNGALYSKSITDKNGNVLEDVSLGSDGPMDTFTAMAFSEETRSSKATDFDREALLEELRAYGIDNRKNGELTFDGQLIRTFVDGVPTGEDGYSIGYVYTNDSGVVDIHTLRSIVQNPDGSYNPMGDLIGVVTDGDKAFNQALIDSARYDGFAQASTDVIEDAGEIDNEAVQGLERYVSFGLNYEYDRNKLSMSWKGKPVHSLYGTETETWFANNLYGSDLGEEAVDLETVYRNGKLYGLKETHPTQSTITLPITIIDYKKDGYTLEEIFARYADYGLVFTPREGGLGTLTWNGKRVKSFADQKPDGGVFSYTDPDAKDGLAIMVEYGQDGRPFGLKKT